MQWTVLQVGLIVSAGLTVLVAGGAAAQGPAPSTSLPGDSQDAPTKPVQDVGSTLEGQDHERVSADTPSALVAAEGSVPQTTPPVMASSEPTAPAPESDAPSLSGTATSGDEFAGTTPSLPAPNVSDHEASGRIGFGVGVMSEPAFYSLFASDPETDEPTDTDDEDRAIPALIGRYWFGTHKSWALELGLAYVNSNIATTSSLQVDTEYVYVRLGAPIAFAHTRHTAFEVIPQLSYAAGESGWEEAFDAPNAQEQAFTFSQWGAALRLVAELHFGFIDVPELSIQSGIGMEYSRLVLRARASDSLFASAERYVATSLRPIGGRGPWDIFIGNLSALYHF